MERIQDENLLSLTIKDKINYPFILASALLKFQESIVKAEGMQSEQEVKEAALCLYNLIPSSWHDDSFTTDYKKAILTRKIDVRNEWCGKKIGEPKYEDEEYIEPYRLVNAIVNLLERRELISKKQRTEIIGGGLVADDESE